MTDDVSLPGPTPEQAARATRSSEAARLAHARERALLDEIATLTARVEALEARGGRTARETRSLRQDVIKLRKEQRSSVQRLRKEIARKRIDRQVRAVPGGLVRVLVAFARRLVAIVRPAPLHVVVVCPAYPGGPQGYGGEFVRARVRLYREAGITVTVVVSPPRPTKRVRYDHEGVTVIRIRQERIADTIRSKAPDVVAVHHLTSVVREQVELIADEFPTTVWVHGYEARDWRELAFNFTDEQLAQQRPVLDAANVERRATMAASFADERIQHVFVSAFMRGVAERFAGVQAVNGTVIHNVIDEQVFRPLERRPEDRLRVLWVRTFAANNYANDLSRDAILALSTRSGFDQLRFTVVGDGPRFEEMVGPLRALPNVEVRQGFVATEELVALHRSHGLMLVPTRWDSQGLTCGEAMSSGLVPITNPVAAIPEFVPTDAGMLCEPDDPAALADAIETLRDDPDRFLAMSAAASRASVAQCGRAATVEREIALLRASCPRRLGSAR